LRPIGLGIAAENFIMKRWMAKLLLILGSATFVQVAEAQTLRERIRERIEERRNQASAEAPDAA
jgi:hypothetical protein